MGTSCSPLRRGIWVTTQRKILDMNGRSYVRQVINEGLENLVEGFVIYAVSKDVEHITVIR